MATPDISVIIPVLNMRRFLPDAIESVYAQTVLDWEIILVDDGSDDGSLELAFEYVQRDPERVRVLTSSASSSHGASAARNRGLQAARGEFIAFLDADDIWLPEKLERQRNLLTEYPDAAMTFARVHYFFENPDEGAGWDQAFAPLEARTYPPPELTVEFLRNADIYPCPTATLIRCSALMEVGGFEERFRKVRTDLAVWVKLSVHFPVYADSAFVARYRQHGQSSVARMFSDPEAYHRNEMDFWCWLLQYLEALPEKIRRQPESLACRQVFRLILAEVMQGRRQNPFAWRWAVLRRIWRYPAFQREARWIRILLPRSM
ncbi:MAG: glycosyltransferase family 2 protein [Anaerolineales bacterium]